MNTTACARSAVLARRVANVVWIKVTCCFSSTSQRDEIKGLRGFRSTAAELRWGVSASEDDGDEGSGDEDVLTSLGASYRAWRVFHREKRAHDYTKSRLVDAIRREAALVKQLAPVGGSVEGIEWTLMRLEDLESAMLRLEEKYANGLEASEKLELAFEALQSHYQANRDRLHEAEAATLYWKRQCQQVLPELTASNSEQQRLIGELRKAKKLAVLAMSRQNLQLNTTRGPQSKKRAYSEDRIV